MSERQFLEIIMIKLPFPIASIFLTLFTLPFIIFLTKDHIKVYNILRLASFSIMMHLILFIYRAYK